MFHPRGSGPGGSGPPWDNSGRGHPPRGRGSNFGPRNSEPGRGFGRGSGGHFEDRRGGFDRGHRGGRGGFRQSPDDFGSPPMNRDFNGEQNDNFGGPPANQTRGFRGGGFNGRGRGSFQRPNQFGNDFEQNQGNGFRGGRGGFGRPDMNAEPNFNRNEEFSGGVANRSRGFRGFVPRGRGGPPQSFHPNNDTEQQFDSGETPAKRGCFDDNARFERPQMNVEEPPNSFRENRGSGFPPRGFGRGFHSSESNRGFKQESPHPRPGNSYRDGSFEDREFRGPQFNSELQSPQNLLPIKDEKPNRVSRFGPPLEQTPVSSVNEFKKSKPDSSSEVFSCVPCNAQFTTSILYRLHLLSDDHQAVASNYIPPTSQNVKGERQSFSQMSFNPVKQEQQISGMQPPGMIKQEQHQQAGRQPPPQMRQQPQLQKPLQNVKPEVGADGEPEFDDSFVVLDWYNSDLELDINPNDFCSARARSHKGFAYIWSGVKATYGATVGKVCFEVRIDGNGDTLHVEDETNPHVLRVGWSVAESSLQLGEEPLSFGYGGTGKASTRRTFKDYGNRFGIGDVIGCYLDLSGYSVKILFTLNGFNLGVAFDVPKAELNGRALFPHIFTKNQHFTVNFGQLPQPMRPILPGFVPIGQLEVSEGLVRGPVAPKSKSDCEVLMLVGLPGAGKTFWAENWAKKYPEKNFNIMGTNVYLDRMKVMNLKRWRNYHGRWDVLIKSCTECFDEILKIASHRKRNYILDQTNVFPTARGRKLNDFRGFNLKAIVIVPNNDEYLRRSAIRSQEEGKAVPEEAVLNMKANFVLPDIEEPFTEVLYSDLSPQEATMIVQQYNAEAIARGSLMTVGVKNFIRRNEQKRAAMGVLIPIGKLINENLGANPAADVWSQHNAPPPFNFKQNQQRPDQVSLGPPQGQNPTWQQGQNQNWPNDGQPSFSGDSTNPAQPRFQSPDQKRNIQTGGFQRHDQARFDRGDEHNRFGSGPPAKARREQSPGSNWPRFENPESNQTFGSGPPDARTRNRSGNKSWSASGSFESGPPNNRTRNRSGNKSWSASGSFESGPPDARTHHQSGNNSWSAPGSYGSGPPDIKTHNPPGNNSWANSVPTASQDTIGWNNIQNHSFPKPPPTVTRPGFEGRPGNWSDEGRSGFVSRNAQADGRSSQGRPFGSGPRAEFPADQSLKRPHFEESEPPSMAQKPFQNSGQSRGQGSWGSGPSHSAEPEIASSSSDTPDYNALMQHLAYYQKQMSSARKGAN